MSLKFQWDKRKAQQNKKKHGVTFEEASTVFGDPLARTIADPQHTREEDRFLILGESYLHRLLVVVFTDRGSLIRIISARPASRGERKDYEENS